jgi:hypothetical protein
VAQPKSEFEKQMIHLEAEIRRLEAEFNMFFAGRLPRPPWETKTRVAALVKRHDQSYINNTADRFRFESLQSRYAKFIELVDRQMTNRELGRPLHGGPVKSASAPPPPRRPAKDDAPKEDPSVVRFARASGPEAESKQVQQLFDRLSAAKKEVGEAPLAIDRLQALVRAQVEKLGAGGADVEFKIGVKDGKVQLTVTADEKKKK